MGLHREVKIEVLTAQFHHGLKEVKD
jgi:hypothetical protein